MDRISRIFQETNRNNGIVNDLIPGVFSINEKKLPHPINGAVGPEL